MKLLFFILIYVNCYSQDDSVTLKVVWSKTVTAKDSTQKDTTYYRVRIKGERQEGKPINMKCCCKTVRKRGEKVLVALNDIQFIKPNL